MASAYTASAGCTLVSHEAIGTAGSAAATEAGPPLASASSHRPWRHHLRLRLSRHRHRHSRRLVVPHRALGTTTAAARCPARAPRPTPALATTRTSGLPCCVFYVPSCAHCSQQLLSAVTFGSLVGLRPSWRVTGRTYSRDAVGPKTY